LPSVATFLWTVDIFKQAIRDGAGYYSVAIHSYLPTESHLFLSWHSVVFEHILHGGHLTNDPRDIIIHIAEPQWRAFFMGFFDNQYIIDDSIGIQFFPGVYEREIGAVIEPGTLAAELALTAPLHKYVVKVLEPLIHKTPSLVIHSPWDSGTNIFYDVIDVAEALANYYGSIDISAGIIEKSVSLLRNWLQSGTRWDKFHTILLAIWLSITETRLQWRGYYDYIMPKLGWTYTKETHKLPKINKEEIFDKYIVTPITWAEYNKYFRGKDPWQWTQALSLLIINPAELGSKTQINAALLSHDTLYTQQKQQFEFLADPNTLLRIMAGLPWIMAQEYYGTELSVTEELEVFYMLGRTVAMPYSARWQIARIAENFGNPIARWFLTPINPRVTAFSPLGPQQFLDTLDMIKNVM